ncbi:MAG: GFA family protein, partial [Burkholderiales bacterium]
MKLKGSCHCGRIKFALRSRTPLPLHPLLLFDLPQNPRGGYTPNIMVVAGTLSVKGKKFIQTYRAKIDGKESEARRHLCSRCASALWVFDP